jgi:hypothetical protein
MEAHPLPQSRRRLSFPISSSPRPSGQISFGLCPIRCASLRLAGGLRQGATSRWRCCREGKEGPRLCSPSVAGILRQHGHPDKFAATQRLKAAMAGTATAWPPHRLPATPKRSSRARSTLTRRGSLQAMSLTMGVRAQGQRPCAGIGARYSDGWGAASRKCRILGGCPTKR